ncbi:MAG: hypothetical protein KBT63_08860 [Porticoccaceae bacterium]|nr:hypothetical protein [Porticoccaceae bacterium]
MRIIMLLVVMLIAAMLVMQQMKTGTDPEDEKSLPYQQQMNKAKDVEQLLQQGVDERGAQFDQMMEQLQTRTQE